MKKLHMKTNKILFVLMIGLSSAITVSCSQQDVTPAQMRQNIIDDAMQPENYKDLKEDLAFLESQGLLQPDSFYNLLQENVTESDDATFNEVIEKAEGLLTQHMKDPFISTLEQALLNNKPLNSYTNLSKTKQIPLFNYVMQRKDNDMTLHNIVAGWLLQWADLSYENEITPLFIALDRGHAEIVRILIEAGANIDIKVTTGGVTPLHYAAFKGHAEIVRILVEHGANINQVTDNGQNALHYAVYNEHTEIVKFLVEHGVNINQVNFDKVSPLLLAHLKYYFDIIDILTTAQLNKNIQKKQQEQKDSREMIIFENQI